jgi:hypothetical protein
MKIHSVGSADIRSGVEDKAEEAWAWAIKVADYTNKNRPGREQTDVIQSVTGRGNSIIWVTKFNSIGDAEKYWEWMKTDEGFQGLFDGANKLIDWDTWERSYYRVRN